MDICGITGEDLLSIISGIRPITANKYIFSSYDSIIIIYRDNFFGAVVHNEFLKSGRKMIFSLLHLASSIFADELPNPLANMKV